MCAEKSLYLAEILVYGLDDNIVERDAIELRIVEGFVLKHPGVKRLWHSAANTLYWFASELGIAVWHLMALRCVESWSLLCFLWAWTSRSGTWSVASWLCYFNIFFLLREFLGDCLLALLLFCNWHLFLFLWPL